MPPIVIRRSGDISLVFTDSEGNQTTLSEDNKLPVVLTDITRELRDLLDAMERVQQQLGRLSGDNLQPGERFE